METIKSYVELVNENETLRRLLWYVYSDGRGYGDDGELQFEYLDFKRMSAYALEAEINYRMFCKIPPIHNHD